MQNIQAQAALFKAWLRGPYIDLERAKGRAQGNHRGQGNQRHDDGHHGDVQVGLAVRQPALPGRTERAGHPATGLR